MSNDCEHIEEHALPSVEAVLACTLVLMTGYSQALQAELHPRQRLAMGERVASNLRLLGDHPLLSPGFKQVLLGLQTRWRAMGACTREAASDGADRSTAASARPRPHPHPGAADEALDPYRPQPGRLH